MIKAFTTRCRELIISIAGKKICPEEIEEFYSKIAPIKEMCVFTIPAKRGARRSKALWAVVQPDLDKFREFSEVNLRAVLKEKFDNAAESLPPYKRLKGFTITLDDLPHTPDGMLKRDVITKTHERSMITGMKGARPETEISRQEDHLLTESETGKKILECLREQCGINRQVVPKDSLELDLGIDSLGRIELASRLKVTFNSDIKDEVISKAFIAKDLILEVTDALRGAKEIPPEDKVSPAEPDYWKKYLQAPPNEEHLEALELRTDFLSRLFRLSFATMNRLIFRFCFSIKSEGTENVSGKGAYILYGNHTSFLDGPAIAAALPRKPEFQLFFFVFIPYFFKPYEKSRILRNIVKMGRLIPFDYSAHFLGAIRSAYLVLHEGKGLCYFPEGLRSSTGEVKKFRRGFGVLAKETGARLIPVAIEGAFDAWPSTAKFPRRHTIRVRFGKPVLPEEMEKNGFAIGAKDSYEAICVAARAKLVDLHGEGRHIA